MYGKEGEIIGDLAYFAFRKPHYELVEEAAVSEAEVIAVRTGEDLERPHKKQKVNENLKWCYCTKCRGKVVASKTFYNHNNQPASSNIPLSPPPLPQVELQQDQSCNPDINQRFQMDFQDQEEEGHDDDSRYQEVSSGSGFEEGEQVPAVISHQFRFESQENQQKQRQIEEEIEHEVAEEEPVFPVVINQQEPHHQQGQQECEAMEAELPDAPSDGEGDRVGENDEDENEDDLEDDDDDDDDDDDPEDDGDENDDEHPMEGGGGLFQAENPEDFQQRMKTTPLYDGATLSIFQWVLTRLAWKLDKNVTDRAFEEDLALTKYRLLPQPNNLPLTLKTCRKVIGVKRLEDFERHVCENDCHLFPHIKRTKKKSLFWKAKDDICPKCDSPRFRYDQKKRVINPRKKFYSLPVTSKLTSLADNPEFAIQMMASRDVQEYNDIWSGSLSKRFPELTDQRNFALSLGVDGVRPFQLAKISVFVILARILNTPPRSRGKKENTLLVAIVPGPTEMKSVDPYLIPFLEEMKILHAGVRTHFAAIPLSPAVLPTVLIPAVPAKAFVPAQSATAQRPFIPAKPPQPAKEAVPATPGVPAREARPREEYLMKAILLTVEADHVAFCKLSKFAAAGAYYACFKCWLKGQREVFHSICHSKKKKKKKKNPATEQSSGRAKEE